MWRKLDNTKLRRYYRQWIKNMAKKGFAHESNTKAHIKKHVEEIESKDPEIWVASMKNLIDIFEEVFKVKPSLKLRVERLERQYKKKPKISCPPPKIK
ncbi:hypothetical protein AMJ51_01935 [Microgenomates bacterium DG_75]|nr:MAG: hypothetical protein AMJ51_01935 [Microgenomates bacterium DG_75]